MLRRSNSRYSWVRFGSVWWSISDVIEINRIINFRSHSIAFYQIYEKYINHYLAISLLIAGIAGKINRSNLTFNGDDNETRQPNDIDRW